MLRNRASSLLMAICAVVLHCGIGYAQTSSTVVQEDFTGTTTTNNWYFYNGACLTASQADKNASPGSPNGCIRVTNTYSGYNGEHMVGGYNGSSGSSQTLPDPAGNGALRFTNGCIPDSNGNCGNGGHSQNGAIISQNAFSTSQGLDITFKTVTYRGDSGGNGAGCPSGTTASNGQCLGTISISPNVTYSCSSGWTLSGSTCTKAATYHSSTRTYTCSAGTLSGTICTMAATATYTCASGYTKSGSGSSTTCTKLGSVVEQDPHQNDGADGISFFLMDGSVDMTNNAIDHIGSWGGSLGYSCSNSNPDWHGMVGAYLGLGIDEYGNFLNGTQNTLGVSNPQALGDNTASGGGQWANRIGLRGEGNIDWYWLNYTYPDLYPTAWATTNSSVCSAKDSNGNCIAYYSEAQIAVKNTCKDGYLADFNNAALTYNSTSPYAVPDYNAIPNAYTIISNTIADEYSSGGYGRQSSGVTPITYRLKLTQDGLLSLDYSYNGGAWTHVLQNESITASNGTVPSTVRFGFAGSTGGASNIHEILCFKATPVTQAASSTTVNQQQSSKVENGSQAYFGYYDPTDWTGRLTANSLVTDSSGNLTIASSANWDAACTLTGVAAGTSCPTTGQTGPTTAQPWQNSTSGGRVMLTWDGSAGIPLEWSSLSSVEQADLDAGDASQTEYRLDYLRGDRSNEIPTSGPSGNQVYRDRDSVLGDIVDSSSTWVGPPSKSIFSAYESPFTWRDRLYPTATMSENGQSYDTYAQNKSTRLNVVYVGANDGLVHGFSAGAYDTAGTTYDSSTNTGQEVLAYMPQGVLETMHNSSDSQLDYANAQYGHNFFVDATPGTGDLYYNGAWHTWLVGGLGAGGAEIYALDVTDPSNFTETNASSLVIGDWTPSSITCTNPTDGTTSNCLDSNSHSYLGNSYGTPQIRRLHNGDWAVMWGNGIGSASGDAGMFILTIDSTGVQTLYYLSTGVAGNNGIAFVTPVDMDGDHVVDYVYAGDLLGNVWRFDLTSNSPSGWAVTPGPIFKTPSGQPITTAVQPDFVTGPIGSTTQLMLFFGSGEKFPLTNSSSASYQTGTQYFYGVWDWNMTGWDSKNSSQFAKVGATTVGSLTSLVSPYTLGTTNLQLQTISIDPSTGDRYEQSASTVCWAGTSTCTGGSSANAKFGWYMALPGTNTAFSTTTYEQVIFNPMIVSTAIIFNSILPAIDSPLMCTPDTNKGWTYALDVRNGGPVPNFFVNPGTSSTVNNLATTTIGYEADASGTSSEVDTSNGSGGTNYYLIFQSNSGGAAPPLPIQPGANISSSRQTWIQIR